MLQVCKRLALCPMSLLGGNRPSIWTLLPLRQLKSSLQQLGWKKLVHPILSSSSAPSLAFSKHPSFPWLQTQHGQLPGRVKTQPGMVIPISAAPNISMRTDRVGHWKEKDSPGSTESLLSPVFLPLSVELISKLVRGQGASARGAP